jgi:hypothetical protein
MIGCSPRLALIFRLDTPQGANDGKAEISFRTERLLISLRGLHVWISVGFDRLESKPSFECYQYGAQIAVPNPRELARRGRQAEAALQALHEEMDAPRHEKTGDAPSNVMARQAAPGLCRPSWTLHNSRPK